MKLVPIPDADFVKGIRAAEFWIREGTAEGSVRDAEKKASRVGRMLGGLGTDHRM